MQITLSGKHFILNPAIGTSPFRVEGGEVPDGNASITLEFAGDTILSGVVGATIHHPGGWVQTLVPMNPGQVASIQSDESGYGTGYFVFNASVLVDSESKQSIIGRVLVLTHQEWPCYFPFTPEVPQACLDAETFITMADGRQRILSLISAGDMVLTLNGPREVKYVTEQWVSYHDMKADKKLRPISVTGPFSEVLMSRQHRIAMGVHFSNPQLVSAIHFHRHLGGKDDPSCGTQIVMPEDGISYMNLWFEHHEIILANGIPVESGWLGGKRAPDLIGPIDWPKVAPYLQNHKNPALPIWSPSKE